MVLVMDGMNSKIIEEVSNKYNKTQSKWGLNLSLLKIQFKNLIWKITIRLTYLIKRMIDIVASFIALILLSPIFLFTWIAIKVEDPGPAIFKQVRVGRWGSTFTMYKYRSMIMNADKIKEKLMSQNESQAGVIFKMKKDPRITNVGRIIRKLSIDELPQLYNVLIGDMSLVGPRPPLPSEVSEYSLNDRKRLEVIPGITGLWQVSGRSDIDFEGQVKLDIEYIKSQSVWNDITILIKTIPAVLLSKGAY